jgi:hypothetical protein
MEEQVILLMPGTKESKRLDSHHPVKGIAKMNESLPQGPPALQIPTTSQQCYRPSL